MKKLSLALLGAAAFAFAGGAQAADLPVKAAPTTSLAPSGFIEMYTGWGWTDPTFEGKSFKSDGWVIGGAGRGNWWLSSSMSYQLDVQAEGRLNSADWRPTDWTNNYFLLAGHLTPLRDPSKNLLGVYGYLGDSTGYRAGLIGVEGQLYWSNFTLYGQLAYETSIGKYSNEWDAFTARLTGRYYINPNLLLEGTGTYSAISMVCGGCDSDLWSWAVKLENMFAKDKSIYVKYAGYSLHTDGGFTARDDKVLVGMRWHLNAPQGTLLGIDRYGATLDEVGVMTLLGPSGIGLFD
jgi:hypothetical protein